MNVRYITAVQQRRRARWERIFGTDELPVKPQPRPHGRGGLAYDLDVDRLHWMARERLVHHISKRRRIDLDEARILVEEEGVTIPAAGCEVIDWA